MDQTKRAFEHCKISKEQILFMNYYRSVNFKLLMYITWEFTNGVPNYHNDMEFYVNGKKWKLFYHA